MALKATGERGQLESVWGVPWLEMGVARQIELAEVLPEVMEELDRRRGGGGGMSGIATGFTDLDDLLDGLQPGLLYLFAGRPAMGKSALLRNLALNCTEDLNVSAALFSLESSIGDVQRTMLSTQALVDGTTLRNGDVDDDEWARLNYALANLLDRHITVVDGISTVQELLRAVYRVEASWEGRAVVLVDCLHDLVSDNPLGWKSRSAELANILGLLRTLGQELRVPVVVSAQVSSCVEHRLDKRPLLMDILDSGALEYIADVVVFLYRDEVYDDVSSDRGVYELNVAKNRNGPIGRVRLAFRGRYFRADNMVRRNPDG